MKFYTYLLHIFVVISFAMLSTLQAKDLITLNTSYYIDAEKLGIDKIIKKEFTPMESSSFSLGFHKEDIWFRLDVFNNSDEKEFILDLNEGFYEKAVLFYEQDNRWQRKTSSMFMNLEYRDVKTRTLAFKVTLLPHEQKRFYIKLNAKYGIFGKFEIIPVDDFYFKKRMNIENFYFMIFGMICVIGIYHFFIYYNIRDKIYGYYLGYSFFYLIYLINISGMLAYLDLQHYVYKIHLSSTLVLVFLLLFTRELFEIKKYSKLISRSFDILIVLFLSLAVMFLFSYSPWNKILNFVAMLVNIYLLFIAIYFIYLGSNKAKLYLFAYSIFLGSLLVFVLVASGVNPYNMFTRYGFIVGGVFEMMFFSFILGSRYSELQKEKISAQEKIITLTEEKEKELNLLVETRTAELVEREDKLKEVVTDREKILKELRHRVKNNFHSLIGMLWLESKADEVSKNVYIFLLNRVKSMSLIYEYMYDPKKTKAIDINLYIKDIIENFGFFKEKVFIEQDVKINILLDNETIISLGMVINEVMNNFTRHIEEMSIFVSLRNEENSIYLQIKVDKHIEYLPESLSYKMIKEHSSSLPQLLFDVTHNENETNFELEFTYMK